MATATINNRFTVRIHDGTQWTTRHARRFIQLGADPDPSATSGEVEKGDVLITAAGRSIWNGSAWVAITAGFPYP